MTELTERIEELKNTAPEVAKELLEQIEQLSSDSYTEKEVENVVLQFDPSEIEEDTQEWQDFRDLQHDIVSYFNAEVEIVSLSVYERDNGFEIEAEENGETYKVYAQLPDCPDSQHSFLDGNDDERILNKIVSKAYNMHSNLDFEAWCGLGAVCDYSHEEYNDYYVIVDDSDDDNHFFAKKSRYSDYYNTFMLTGLDSEEIHNDEELMSKLNEILKDLQK